MRRLILIAILLLIPTSLLSYTYNSFRGDGWVRQYHGDFTGPSVALTLTNRVGTDPYYENGTVEWTATCTDPSGVKSVQLYQDNVAVGTADTTAPYGDSWVTGYAVNTTDVLTARCIDLQNNVANSVSQTVTIDVQAPVVGNFSAQAMTSTVMDLSFSAPVDVGSGVSSTRSILLCSPSPCTPTAFSTTTANQVDVTGLTAETVYDFRISSADNVGNIGLSAIKTASLSDLVAFFQFEGNGNDSSLTANHGTVMGNPTYVPGITAFGQAIAVDGAGDYLTVPNHAAYDLPTSLTLSIWVNCNNTCGTNHTIMAQWGTLTRYLVRTGTVDRTLTTATLLFGGASGVVTTTASNPMSATGWNHLVITYDGASIRLYVNGALAATTARVGSIDQGSVPLTIGARDAGAIAFTGQLDRMKMSKRVWSLDDVKREYDKRL